MLAFRAIVAIYTDTVTDVIWFVYSTSTLFSDEHCVMYLYLWDELKLPYIAILSIRIITYMYVGEMYWLEDHNIT